MEGDSGSCQCSPKCRLRATDGEPFALAHDKRPEMQEARKAMMRERGLRGGAKSAAQKQVARDGIAEKLTGRTVPDQLITLDHVIQQVASGAMSSKTGAVIVAAIRASRDVLIASKLERENAQLRALIIEKFPHLKKALKAKARE